MSDMSPVEWDIVVWHSRKDRMPSNVPLLFVLKTIHGLRTLTGHADSVGNTFFHDINFHFDAPQIDWGEEHTGIIAWANLPEYKENEK